MTDAERLAAKIERRGEDECWPWTGSIGRGGYGYFGLKGRTRTAHRAALIIESGEDPEGLLACHTCDNPPCCNTKHLYWGTYADNSEDNTRRGRNSWALLTHCKNGHEFTPENTYVWAGVKGIAKTNWRGCRTCKNIHSKESKIRKRLSAPA